MQKPTDRTTVDRPYSTPPVGRPSLMGPGSRSSCGVAGDAEDGFSPGHAVPHPRPRPAVPARCAACMDIRVFSTLDDYLGGTEPANRLPFFLCASSHHRGTRRLSARASARGARRGGATDPSTACDTRPAGNAAMATGSGTWCIAPEIGPRDEFRARRARRARRGLEASRARGVRRIGRREIPVTLPKGGGMLRAPPSHF